MNESNLNSSSKTDWERIDAMADDEIDVSDSPPLTDDFFAKAKWLMPGESLPKKTMNVENAVFEFLQTLTSVHKQLQELAHRLRSYPEVKSVKVHLFVPSNMTQHHWDEEQQKQAVGSDFGVSAELCDKTIIGWWLEARCVESGWTIAANIYKSDVEEEGCHKIAEYSEQHSLSLEATLRRLLEAGTWFLESDISSILSA